MNNFEKKLAEQLNISDQILIDTANLVVSHLLTNSKTNTGPRINGRVIREAIDVKLKGNDRMYIMKLFKPGESYTIDEVREGVMLGMFESECHISGENDLFIMLPDSKLILCIEIKRRMQDNEQHASSHCTNKIDRNLKSASKQLKKNARFISSKHGAILSTGWKFAKVCALSPTLYNSNKICSNCKRFILTSDILKTPGGLAKWWIETGLSGRASLIDQKSKDEAYAEFQLFFNRIVCLSSVRLVANTLNTWAHVQGNNKHHMVAGHTTASQDTHNKAASDSLEIEDILKSAHHAYKTLCFNRDQMVLLTTDNFPSALFLSDFGAGN